jgi:RNA polymerase sigma-70 factor (ECF subfamily)
MKTVPTSKATGFDPAQIIKEHQAGVWRYLRALGCDSQQADDFTHFLTTSVFRHHFA